MVTPSAPFFDRQGRRISPETWRSLQLINEYVLIGHCVVVVRHQPVRVTSLWCGWMLSDYYEPPMLFETRVQGGPFNGAAWYYPTEREALLGHQVAVELARDGECDITRLSLQTKALRAMQDEYPHVPMDGPPSRPPVTSVA